MAAAKIDKAEILFTSPPYSDQREYKCADLDINGLTKIFSIFRDFSNYFVINLGIQYKNNEVYTYWDKWVEEARKSGLKLLSWNVWDKINSTSVSSQIKMFAVNHEWIFVFGDTPKQLNRTWDKSQESKKRERYYHINNRGQKVTTRRQKDGSVKNSTIGEIYNNKQLGTVLTTFAEMSREITSHPAMFPVELPFSYIEAMTDKGDIVIDPFLGSGTTMIAAHQLGRRCFGIEIEPSYVAVCLDRFKRHTGIEPVRLTSAQP